MTPDLMTPAVDHIMHLSDDDMMLSLSTMDETSFENIILAVCDGSVCGYAPPDDARVHCDAVLALSPDETLNHCLWHAISRWLVLVPLPSKITRTSSPSPTVPLLEARRHLVLVEACLAVVVVAVLLVAVLSRSWARSPA